MGPAASAMKPNLAASTPLRSVYEVPAAMSNPPLHAATTRPARAKGQPLLGGARDLRAATTAAAPRSLLNQSGDTNVQTSGETTWKTFDRRASVADGSSPPTPMATNARLAMDRRPSMVLDALPAPSFDAPPPPPSASSERFGALVGKLPPPPLRPISPSRDRDSSGSLNSTPAQTPPSPFSISSPPPLRASSPILGASPHSLPSSLSLPAPLLPPAPSAPLALSTSAPPPLSPRSTSDRGTATESMLSASIKRNKRAAAQKQEETADHRKFRAHSYGGEYLGPKISAPPLPASATEAPLFGPYFVDSFGAVYDRNYVPIAGRPGSNPVAVAERLMQKIPAPSDFTNFFAYEEALLNWKAEVEEALKGVQLPVPMGQHYNRPRLAQQTDASALALKSMDMPNGATDSVVDVAGLVPAAETEFIEHQLPADPWHSVLVPVEPQPESFSSYEDYEAALLRWASLCSNTLPSIPPHPAQLPSLLPMRNVIEDKARQPVKGKDPEKETKTAHPNSTRRSRKSTALPPVSRIRWEGLESTEVARPSGGGIRKETCQQIHKMFAGLAVRLNGNKDKHACSNQPMLPTLHGSFPVPNRPAAALPLRRPGLTETDQRMSLDCPAEIEGKRVEFRLPDHDLDIVWKDLFGKTAEEYRTTVRNTLIEQEQRHRLDALNSWFHPKTPASVLQQQRNELLTFFMSGSTNWTDLFCRNQSYLDKFQDFIVSRPYADDDETPTVISALSRRLDFAQFLSLLALVQGSNSLLVQAKVCVFLFESFQDGKMKNFVEQLIAAQDLANLSLLVYTLCVTQPRPVDLYPYNEADVMLLKKLIPDSSSPLLSFVRAVFVLHYLNLLEKPLSQGIFLGLNSFVLEQRRVVIGLIDGLFTRAPGLFAQILSKGVASRSVTISHLSSFVCLQLISNHDQTIQKYLRPPQIKLPPLLRTLGQSKFSHVQHLTRIMFTRMQTEFWQTVLYSSYTLENIKEDLLRPCGPTKPHTLTQVLLDWVLPLLKTNTPHTLSPFCPPLTDERLFSELLTELCDAEKNGYKNHLESVGELLCELIAMWARGGAITVSAEKAAAKRLGATMGQSSSRSNLFTLSVSVTDFRALIALTEVRKLRENENPNIYKAKTHIADGMRILQYFMELPEVFTFARSLIGDQTLFSKILAACRDPNGEYNRAAYQLFFKMIQFHANVVDALAKANLLQPFLEVAGPSFPNSVICNSLHYIAKVFSLEMLEQKRLAAGKSPKRHGEQVNLKTIQADLKLLTKFFTAKRLFIKVHIIYMRLNTNPFSYPGLLFHELANLFWVICNVPACKKLLRDLQTNAEYREKLTKISQMYTPALQREMNKIMSKTGMI